MFAKLARLGRVLAEDASASLAETIREGFTGGPYRLVELRFTSEGDYDGWDWRELSSSEAAQMPYVYPGGSRKPFVSPIGPFSPTSGEMHRRMRDGLEAIKRWGDTENRDHVSEEVAAVASAMETQREGIINDLDAAREELDDQDHALLFQLHINDGGQSRPVCQQVMDGVLKRSVAARFGRRENEDIVLAPGHCCLCGRHRDVLYGDFSKLKTYSLDQPGRIVGGFAPLNAARNFPVCAECATYASHGIDMVLQNLRFHMFGIDYLIIPDATEDELLIEFYQNAVEWRQKRASLQKTRLGRLSRDEREILDLIGREYSETSNLSFSMLFFRQQKAQWHILAEVAEVLPSWLHRIYQAKRRVEKEEPENSNVEVTLGVVRDATGQAQGAGARESNRLFLEWAEAILRGGNLERAAVLRIIVDHILRVHREDAGRAEGQSSRAYFVTLEASLLVRLLEELNIINAVGGSSMISKEFDDNRWAEYLRDREEFFGGPESRVAFLTGALVLQLARVQKDERNLNRAEDAPIYKKLRGLRIDQGRLQRLLGETKEKLIAYDADWQHRDVQELLSSEWTHVGANWELSTDETTFYFTLGLNLSWHINRPKEDETKESEEE